MYNGKYSQQAIGKPAVGKEIEVRQRVGHYFSKEYLAEYWTDQQKIDGQIGKKHSLADNLVELNDVPQTDTYKEK